MFLYNTVLQSIHRNPLTLNYPYASALIVTKVIDKRFPSVITIFALTLMNPLPRSLHFHVERTDRSTHNLPEQCYAWLCFYFIPFYGG